MSESNKSYRIRTNVGEDNFVSVNLEQDYDVFDILSLKINSADVYRLHNSNYGVVVGRVLANNGFGIPNAKISIFIESDPNDGGEMLAIYPYKTTASRDENGVRYNLLPDEKVANCHQVIGTFPNKRFVLDNDDIIEVFDKYYKYTTRTNGSGDYIIVGVPTGNQTLHMDLDLSDCGILSQRPRDFVYKGYTIEQFENPNMFKTSTALDSLSQVFSQDQSVYVQPFWGNESLGETIGITRADIDVAFKFEPTCVFMGCVASDNSSNGISKKCIPTPHMGDMDELTTGEGTIEMIRKTYAGSVEEFQVKGTELIDGNGIWCYQIPMNLDYMMTDEYGNMVPTDNPDKGIPTRTRVRFRISMQDMEENTDNYFRPKVLVPHNPQNLNGTSHEDYDYDFGTNTKDESFRDLFWNNVYTVKSYIPRFQKRKVGGWKEKKFSGIKHVQDFGRNNPMPYNNIRIIMPFMFKVMCILIKIFIKIVSVINTLISMLGNMLSDLGTKRIPKGIKIKNWKISIKWWYPFKSLYGQALKLKMNVIDEGLCPDLENWYFSPMFKNNLWSPAREAPEGMERYDLLKQTLNSITNDDDTYSVDDQNQDDEDEAKCLTVNTDYLIACIEMNLAQEYKVINFDFYNDWINGLIYIPRFMRYIRKKKKFLGITIARQKVRGCMDDTKIFSKSRRYTQMCSLGYGRQIVNGKDTYSKVTTNLKNKRQIKKSNNLHKKRGLTQEKIFGKNGGLVHEKQTMYDQYVYYLKPCEWTIKTVPLHRKVNLFATDLVLLGSLNECDINGIPQAFKHLNSSSYIMPTNLALTNMEENGYLYAYGDNGTMCSQNNQTDVGTNTDELSKPMRRIDPNSSSPLESELKFYSGASSNYDVNYDDPSDTIAMTEAAGISWNYSGPGQGENIPKKLYYPGGHFLGLSCVNSQTNIKSCINLERICEAGTAMSQRKEDVGAVKNENNESVLEYVYTIPTGLISGDDIIDDEFRTMFATMNKKRLIATKLNPETGYKTYDFVYSNPVNFSGELVKYTGPSTPYNEPANDVTDESTALLRYGIEPGSTRDDFDVNETYHSQKRTIEFSSIDYYMFRLGLDYQDMKRGASKHLRQFAKSDNGYMYLPQYENSFYFYFGVHDGSTAMDEFNKQFFSQCENSVLSEREPSVYLIIDDFSVCEGVSNVTPYVNNMEAPLLIHLKNSNGYEEYGFPLYVEDEDDLETFQLERGEYIITITDSEGSEVTTLFSVGKDVLEGSFRTYDFNVSDSYLPRNESNSNMYYGGYIVAEGIRINGTGIKNLKVSARSGFRTAAVANVTSAGTAELYLSTPNVEYDLYVSYNCEGGRTIELYAGTVVLYNTDTNYLTIGPVLKTRTKSLPNKAMRPLWWNQYGVDGNGSNFTAWNIRKSLIRPYRPGEITFSSSLEAQNGMKAIWMTPQNAEGVLRNTFASSEFDAQIPNGYTVDDEASNQPTYGHINYNFVTQNNAVSYNGLVVGGDFAGIVYSSQNGEEKNVTVIRNNELRTGEGCMFKPLPDGDLIPAIYIGGKIRCLCNREDWEAATAGVVYPTIVYPIIHKPFSVHANYFEINSKYLEPIPDGEGNEATEIVTSIVSGKCEAHIINGLTYKNYFCGESYMSFVKGFKYDDETNEYNLTDEDDVKIYTPIGDMDGVQPMQTTDRVIYLSGCVHGQVEDVSYLITEGFPFYTNTNMTDFSAYKDDAHPKRFSAATLYSSIVESADLPMDATFYENIFYRKTENTYTFIGDGNSDREIKYYLIPMSYTNGAVYRRNGTSVDDYISYAEGWGNGENVYLLGQYTSKATFDTEGTDVIVRLDDAFMKVNGIIPFTHREDSDDGKKEVVFETKKLNDNWDLSQSNVEKYVNKVNEKFEGRVTIPHKKDVKFFETGDETHENSWTRRILNNCNTNTEIKNMVADCNTSEFIVVGVKHFQNANGTGTGNRCMIYLYPIEVKKPKNNLSISLSYPGGGGVSSISVGSGSTSVTLNINCAAKVSYTASTQNDWISLSNATTGTNSSDNGAKYSITISIGANSNTESRNGSVIIESKSSEDQTKVYATVTLTISQDGAYQAPVQTG